MKIQPIKPNNRGFQGRFVRNQAWKDIVKYCEDDIKSFKPYIKIIERHCPDTAVYKFEKTREYCVDGDYNVYTLYRNKRSVGKSALKGILILLGEVKQKIVEDAFGRGK